MRRHSPSTNLFNFLEPFHIASVIHSVLDKSFVDNIIINISYNFNKYIQYKHVWKLFEVVCLHLYNIIALHCCRRGTDVLSLYCLLKKTFDMVSQCLVPYIGKKVNSYSFFLGQQPSIALQIQNFH